MAEERARLVAQAARARRLRLILCAGGLAGIAAAAAAVWVVAKPGSGGTWAAGLSRAQSMIQPDATLLPTLPDLPPRPPRPANGPQACRGGELAPQVKQIPAEIQKLASGPAEPYLKAVGGFLAAGDGDEFAKVKRLHDWVADTIDYDVEGLRGRSPRMASLDQVVRSHRAVCAGYANVFAAVCKGAGVEVRVISGWARSLAGDVLADSLGDADAHAWNAVRLQDKWYLIDTTWDAGNINGDAFERSYSTDYLFMPPEAFAYMHLPKEPADQLLQPPISTEEFLARPLLRGGFFAAGLALAAPVDRLVGNAQFDVLMPDDVEISTHLMVDNGGREVEGHTLMQSTATGVAVHVRPPTVGLSILRIFAGPKPNGVRHLVADVRVEPAAEATPLFPEVASTLSELRANLIAPLDAVLPSGTPVAFRVRVPKVDAVSVSNGEHWTPLLRIGQSDEFAAEIVLQPAVTRLQVHEKPDDTSWSMLAEYRVGAAQ